MTKKEHLAEMERVSRENNLLSIGLQCAMNDAPEATERATVDTCRYTLRLYRSTACHGGIVLMTFHHAGQSDSTTAHYLEEIRFSNLPELLPLRCALEHLLVARQRLLDGRAA